MENICKEKLDSYYLIIKGILQLKVKFEVLIDDKDFLTNKVNT